MTPIHKNQHFWTFLPELGPNYSYCERCDKAKYHPTNQLMTYKQALKHKAQLENVEPDSDQDLDPFDPKYD